MARAIVLALLFFIQLKYFYFSLLSLGIPHGYFMIWLEFIYDVLVIVSFMATVVGGFQLIRRRTTVFHKPLAFALYFNFFYFILYLTVLVLMRKDFAYITAEFVISFLMQLTFIIVTMANFKSSATVQFSQSKVLQQIPALAIDMLVVLACTAASYSLLAVSGWIISDDFGLSWWTALITASVIYYSAMLFIFRQTIGQLLLSLK